MMRKCGEYSEQVGEVPISSDFSCGYLLDRIKQCEQVGYEIRYGSAERGCWQQAKQVLEEFQRCTKGTMLISPRKPSRYKPLRDLF
jgi:hypothetical protein